MKRSIDEIIAEQEVIARVARRTGKASLTRVEAEIEEMQPKHPAWRGLPRPDKDFFLELSQAQLIDLLIRAGAIFMGGVMEGVCWIEEVELNSRREKGT